MTESNRKHLQSAEESLRLYAESKSTEDLGDAIALFLQAAGLRWRQAIVESERVMVRIDPTYVSTWVDANGTERPV